MYPCDRRRDEAADSAHAAAAGPARQDLRAPPENPARVDRQVNRQFPFPRQFRVVRIIKTLRWLRTRHARRVSVRSRADSSKISGTLSEHRLASTLLHLILATATPPIDQNERTDAMAAENLKELFVEELRDMYDAEKQLTKALPKMARAAENEELRSAFEDHFEITKGHVSRCEEVFKLLGIPARGKPCEGMKGIIKEG